jgi:hypothetical protein
MEEIQEFLENEKLKSEQTIKIIKDDKKVYISLDELIAKYHLFLKKKSYLK